MFFFHFNMDSLNHRSIYDRQLFFVRDQNIEKITQEWEANKSDLTREYKQKHKYASKRNKKMKQQRSFK